MVLLLVEVCVHCDKVSVYTHSPAQLNRGVTYNSDNEIVCKACSDRTQHIINEDDISFE